MPTMNDMQALQILRDANLKSYDAQSRAQEGALRTQVGAKLSSYGATKQQVEGDKISSVSKAAVGGLGMALNYKLSLHANKLSSTPPAGQTLPPDILQRRGAQGAGLNAATQGNGVGNVVSGAGDAADQVAGGAHMSSEAKVAGKFAEVEETMAAQALEQAKAGKEKTAKGMDSVEDFAKDMFERAKQVLDKLF